MTDLRPSLAPARRAFGVPVRLTPPGGLAIEATAIALTLSSEFPAGADLSMLEGRRLYGLSRAEIGAALPRGTVLEIGDEVLTVDSVVYDDGDDVRVLVR